MSSLPNSSVKMTLLRRKLLCCCRISLCLLIMMALFSDQNKSFFPFYVILFQLKNKRMRPTSENIPSFMCAQRRFRSACAFAQADQNLHWTHFGIAKDTRFLHADYEHSDLTARMCRMIWIFVGRTCPKVRFLTLRLKDQYSVRVKVTVRQITSVIQD